MRHTKLIGTVLAGSIAIGPIAGCESLPGSSGTQGAVIGGVGGAAAGAAIAKNNRLLGALIGGLVGAGGGYLIGAQVGKVKDKKSDEAEAAVQKAQTDPATAEEAKAATTADLNSDGFVTLDEVIAMKKAGLSDSEMTTRLQATGQVFELTPEQERRLADEGVSWSVIDKMRTINQAQREELLGQSDQDVISKPAGSAS